MATWPENMDHVAAGPFRLFLAVPAESDRGARTRKRADRRTGAFPEPQYSRTSVSAFFFFST